MGFIFRYIEAEVAGGMGNRTVIDTSTHPPIVHSLHYQFDDWPGDDILETFPCYIVTERLKREIEEQALIGVIFANVITSTSKIFKELYPDRLLPKFYWLKVVGVSRGDDFGIAEDHRLMISGKVFDILESFNISNASFEFDN